MIKKSQLRNSTVEDFKRDIGIPKTSSQSKKDLERFRQVLEIDLTTYTEKSKEEKEIKEE